MLRLPWINLAKIFRSELVATLSNPVSRNIVGLTPTPTQRRVHPYLVWFEPPLVCVGLVVDNPSSWKETEAKEIQTLAPPDLQLRLGFGSAQPQLSPALPGSNSWSTSMPVSTCLPVMSETTSLRPWSGSIHPSCPTTPTNKHRRLTHVIALVLGILRQLGNLGQTLKFWKLEPSLPRQNPDTSTILPAHLVPTLGKLSKWFSTCSVSGNPTLLRTPTPHCWYLPLGVINHQVSTFSELHPRHVW